MAVTLPETKPQIANDAQVKGSEHRAVLTFFVLAALSLLSIGWIAGGVTFDGAHYFLEIVNFQKLFQPLQRFSSAPFESPTLFASTLTKSIVTLRHVFGVSYAFAPLSAILASWFVIRHRSPDLMVWPIVGIGVVAFPALVFPISESGIVAEWAWPLFLVTLVGLDETPSIVVGLLFSVFLLFLAANALVVFLLVAAVAVVRAVARPAVRSRALSWAGVMLIFALIRYFVLHRDFAGYGHRTSVVVSRLQESLSGPAFFSFLIAASAAALLLVLLRSRYGRASSWLTYVPTGLMVVSGMFLVLYASNDKSWAKAIDARDLTLLLEIPIMLVCVIDEFAPRLASTQELDKRNRYARNSVIVVAGVVLVIGAGVFCASWTNLTDNLTSRLESAASYCVPPSLLEERGTVLEMDYFPADFQALVIDLQSDQPAHVPLSSDDCRVLSSRGVLILDQFRSPANGDWFTFKSNLLTSIRKHPS
jgi:hypothetical protein